MTFTIIAFQKGMDKPQLPFLFYPLSYRNKIYIPSSVIFLEKDSNTKIFNTASIDVKDCYAHNPPIEGLINYYE